MAYGYACGLVYADCGTASTGDAGPLADSMLFRGLETLSSSAAANNELVNNCGGYVTYLNMCQSYRYWQALSACTDSLFTWANANDENYFKHKYGGAISSSNRATSTQAGSCNSTGTGTGGTLSVWLEQPEDSTGNAALKTFFTTGGGGISGGPFLVSPSPAACPTHGCSMGVAQDNFPLTYSDPNSAEFGNTYQYVSPSPSPGAAAVSYTHGIGDFLNAMSPLHFQFKGFIAGAHFCYTLTPPPGWPSGHCYGDGWNHDAYSFDQYDNRFYMDDICTTVTGVNFDNYAWENAVDRNTGALPLLIEDLNTAYWNDTNHTSDGCAKLLYPLEETLPAYWSEQLGIVWLAPNPADGKPDVIEPWRTNPCQSACSMQDVAYYPAYEVQPSNPEETPAPYVFNGSTLSSSTWCEASGSSPNGIAGDSGGVKALVVDCPVALEPVMVIQYQHCRILGVDTGACAAVVNTSTSSVSCCSTGWFTVDPFSTYNGIFSFSQCNGATMDCEGGYIPTGYNGSYLGALQGANNLCTNTTYCLNDAADAIQYAAIPSTIPAQSAIFLSAEGATPAPTATPGALTATPGALTFLHTAAPQNLTVTQPNYTGSITLASSNCPTWLTITPGSAHGPTPAPFSVTANNGNQVCLIQITGFNSQQIVVDATITTPTPQPSSTPSSTPGPSVLWEAGVAGKDWWINANTYQCGSPNAWTAGAAGTSLAEFTLNNPHTPLTCGRNQMQPTDNSSDTVYPLAMDTQYTWTFTYYDGLGTTQPLTSPGMGPDAVADSLIFQIHANGGCGAPSINLGFQNNSSGTQQWFLNNVQFNDSPLWTGGYTPGEIDTWEIVLYLDETHGYVYLYRNGSEVYSNTDLATTCYTSNWWNMGPYKWRWELSGSGQSTMNQVNAGIGNMTLTSP